MQNQIKDIKEHEKKLLGKTMEFTDRLARIEENQQYIENQQELTNQHLDNMHSDFIVEMHKAIDGRMNDTNHMFDRQQATLETITQIQSRQTQQIEEIQKTLKHFTKIEDKVNYLEAKTFQHEERLKFLEDDQKNKKELQKEKTKARGAVIAAIVAAISAIISTLITAIM